MLGVGARRVALALFAITMISASCGGGSSLTLAAYFPRVATLASALDIANATPLASGSFPAREASLRTFASGLDQIDVPSATKQSHHDLTVASKNLADAAHRASGGAVASPQPESAVFVRDWQTACHVLQDVALAKKIDVDLHCATALHVVDSGG
jgi:uncharacterized membrane protein